MHKKEKIIKHLKPSRELGCIVVSENIGAY
jgi:hypothetical protein